MLRPLRAPAAPTRAGEGLRGRARRPGRRGRRALPGGLRRRSARPDAGVALVAVGGYGREELAPFSDLDVVLVHDAEVDVGEWAGQIWYPLWDSGPRPSTTPCGRCPRCSSRPPPTSRSRWDCSTCGTSPATRTSPCGCAPPSSPPGAATPGSRLPELRDLVRDRVPPARRARARLGPRPQGVRRRAAGRHRAQGPGRDLARRRAARRAGELPAGAARRPRRPARGRRARHRPGRAGATGRTWRPCSTCPTPRRCSCTCAASGRRMTHLSRLTWRRVDAVLRRPPRAGAGRRPQLEPIGGGLAVAYEEVVLDRGARPGEDPLPAAAGGRRGRRARTSSSSPPPRRGWCGQVPAPGAVARRGPRPAGAACSPPDPGCSVSGRPSTRPARSGRSCRSGSAVRLLPHASTVHRFTVDRHLVETCIEAVRADPAGRAARRADGRRAAARHRQGPAHRALPSPASRSPGRSPGGWASTSVEADLVATLVRWHLLLPETATTPRPGGPGDRRRWSPSGSTTARSSSCSPRSPRPTRGPPRRRPGPVARLAGAQAGRRTGSALVAGAARRPVERPRGRGPRRGRATTPLAWSSGSSRTTPTGRRHGARRGPGRPARRRRRDAGAAAGHRPCRPRLDQQDDAGGVAVSRWRIDRTGLDPAVLRAADRDRRRGPRRPGRAGCDGGRRRSRRPWCCGRRPPRTATVLEVRAGRPARRARTWCARRWPGSGSRCARRTSTPSDRRRWTCSTSRSSHAGAAHATGGPPTPRTPYARRWETDGRPVGWTLVRPSGRAGCGARPRRTNPPEEPLVRHSLRPAAPRPSRTSAARAGSPRPTSTPPPGRSGWPCSRPTSRCRWSRTSSPRSRSAPAAPRSARR